MNVTRVSVWLTWALLVVASGCAVKSSDGSAAVTTVAEASSAGAEPLAALPVDTDWTLDSATASGLARAEASAISLRIEADRLSGDSGCNRYSASYAWNGTTLSIGPAMATKRGCPPPTGEIEQALFAVLPSIDAASMAGDALLLHARDGSHLRFVRSAPTP